MRWWWEWCRFTGFIFHPLVASPGAELGVAIPNEMDYSVELVLVAHAQLREISTGDFVSWLSWLASPLGSRSFRKS